VRWRVDAVEWKVRWKVRWVRWKVRRGGEEDMEGEDDEKRVTRRVAM
jgi:hypothetical protein